MMHFNQSLGELTQACMYGNMDMLKADTQPPLGGGVLGGHFCASPRST